VRVLFCGLGWRPIVDAIRARLPAGDEVALWDRRRPLEEAAREFEVLLPSNGGASRSVIEASPRLRLIQQPAVGVDGIDLEAAKERGIPVCNAPGTNSDSVAQAALLLMLALARRLKEAETAFERAEIGEPLGVELSGKVLGLIGLGRSGGRLKAAAEALGMRVLSVRSTDGEAELDALLAAADFVSLHCPLTPRTRGLLNRVTFGKMKSGAHLINCARGGIVDQAALEEALRSGRLRGAGLDVFEDEPWDPRASLFRRADVIALPHVAGSTEEAFGRIADITAGNIRRLADDRPLEHRIG
jgi:D-3-phosphoglycerate dehydrogenase